MKDKDEKFDYLNKNFWTENKWQQLQELLNDPEKYFHQQYELVQNHRACQNAIFSKIEACRDTYLYGAGKIANTILFDLMRNQVKVKGIIVSNTENNPNDLMKVPVDVIENFNFDKDRDLILISIKKDSQSEVLYQLKMNGYKNIILVTKEFRAALGYLSCE